MRETEERRGKKMMPSDFNFLNCKKINKASFPLRKKERNLRPFEWELLMSKLSHGSLSWDV